MPTPQKPKRWRSSSSRSPAGRRRRSVRWKPWGSTRARGRSWRGRARRSRARWSARRRRCGPIPGPTTHSSTSCAHSSRCAASPPSPICRRSPTCSRESSAPSASCRARDSSPRPTWASCSRSQAARSRAPPAKWPSAADPTRKDPIAGSSAAAFAAELRRAGDLLARSGTGDEEALATELDALTAALRAIQPGAARAPAAPAPAPRPAPASRPTPPPAPAPLVRGVNAAPVRVEPAMPETPDLVGSWAAYQRLLERGIGSASLAELIAGVQSAPATPAPGSPVAAPAAPAVDVRALLYRGDRALQRAKELREAAKRVSGDELRALVDEVCDLVALALEPSP